MRALRSVPALIVLLLVGLVGAGCAPPGAEQLSTGAVPTSFRSADMGVSLPVHVGISQPVVDQGGAAWDTYSAAPGGQGTALLFGHRNSHGSPFYRLHNLQPGDEVDVGGADGRTYRYRVVGTRIVRPTWDDILAYQPANGRGLSLISCHPIGSISERIVVDAELVGG